MITDFKDSLHIFRESFIFVIILSMNWHSLDIKKVRRELETDFEKGLSFDEAQRREEEFGPNSIKKKRDLSLLKLAIAQFKSPLVYILFVAAGISVLIGKNTDAAIILAATLVNAAFGFWKEFKTRRTLQALKDVLRVKATVLRDGKKMVLLKKNLVPGDIVFISAGDKIPADCRLIEGSLQVSEAVLTGEWLPVDKEVGTVEGAAERNNMLFAGSLCERGRGKAVVVETGDSTEMGGIAQKAQSIEEIETPLSQKLSAFTKKIAVALGGSSLIILLFGLMHGYSGFEMFESSLAIAVGGIPEALPIVLTLGLAVGMSKILDKRGLVKNLSSVETLGGIEVICTDKTKTLTYGHMKLSEVWTEKEDSLYRAMALTNEAFVENPEDDDWVIRGAPTDRALLEGASENGFIKHEMDEEISDRRPFSSELKMSAVLLEGEMLVAGAPEKVLELCGVEYREEMKKMTDKGLRVIALARKETEEIKLEGLEFLGLVGFEDPVREDAGQALRLCRKAGIEVVMVTGDHKRTALGIAEQLDFQIKKDQVMTGEELENLSDEELEEKINYIRIFARTTPLQKIRIVEAWQNRGKVVAMTGDGVNDGPALVKADVGIALNSGTEVAKGSADLILLDDSFSIIVEAVERGRTVFDNLRKSISYVLADSFTAIVLVGNAILFGWPLPILPMQLFWNNIVEDTLPDLAFAFEEKEERVMERKPIPRDGALLNKEMKYLIFVTGLVDEVLSIFLFWVIWKRLDLGLEYARTMVFGSISIDTAFVVFAYKNFKKSIWEINPFSNKVLLLGSVVVLLSFALAIYVPFFQRILGTVPLDLLDWTILIGIAIFNLGLIEFTKRFFIND